MSLRLRLVLALAPLAVLLAVLGVVGGVQLHRAGDRIDAILRENYVSVQAMFRLNEAAERIDSSFQFALAGREADAARLYAANWPAFDDQFATQAGNVTIRPAEDGLVARLATLRAEYRRRGERFYALPAGSPERAALYFGTPGEPGLLGLFTEIRAVTGEILRLNRENMEQARDDARAVARENLVGFGVGLVVAAALVAGAGWYLVRTVLAPVRAVTEAAQAVGVSGRLEREVPVTGHDELGRLAAAFNAMTRQLREYRRSNLSQLLRARRTAQATIDSFPDPVLVLDPDGRVELANPAALRVLGAAPAGDQPGPVWQPPGPLAEPVRAAVHGRREAVAESFDQAVTFRVGGEDRSFLPQVRPIRDPGGEPLGAAVVLHDVTRFRLLDQLKTDLVATVSHELKTPLTAVRLAVHVLLEEAVGPLTPKQADLLVDARDNAGRLLALIEQLLALARLQRPETGNLRERADPADLLRRAADAVRGRADDKHVAVEVRAAEPLPGVEVDPERLGLALGNLLDNAVTYTPAGGTVALSAAAIPGGRVELSVSDTGVGIPAEHLPHVFERFFRVPGQSAPAGTGLGLAIVKEVVTAHGGTVACESEPGRGTTFRVTLPAAAGEVPR
jgi:NtrC-family two-component system sensor histidine kinase KinB